MCCLAHFDLTLRFYLLYLAPTFVIHGFLDINPINHHLLDMNARFSLTLLLTSAQAISTLVHSNFRHSIILHHILVSRHT